MRLRLRSEVELPARTRLSLQNCLTLRGSFSCKALLYIYITRGYVNQLPANPCSGTGQHALVRECNARGLWTHCHLRVKHTQTRKESWRCHRTEEMERVTTGASNELLTTTVTHLFPLQIKPKTFLALCVEKHHSIVSVSAEER